MYKIANFIMRVQIRLQPFISYKKLQYIYINVYKFNILLLKILAIIVPLLISVAYFTIAERKLMVLYNEDEVLMLLVL